MKIKNTENVSKFVFFAMVRPVYTRASKLLALVKQGAAVFCLEHRFLGYIG
jgi:hypothetical protein